jgi:hypothetical protein
MYPKLYLKIQLVPRTLHTASTINKNHLMLAFKGLMRGMVRLKCDGKRAETRFRLSAKRTSPFKSAGVSVQSTTRSRGVRISGSNAGCTMFRYPLHSPVSPSLPLPCVTVCHHISTGHYDAYYTPPPIQIKNQLMLAFKGLMCGMVDCI